METVENENSAFLAAQCQNVHLIYIFVFKMIEKNQNQDSHFIFNIVWMYLTKRVKFLDVCTATSVHRRT